MMEELFAFLASLLGIVVIDLVLSGDNALVIGMAARRLPPSRRRLAILLGGAGAITLRVLFAAVATLLLAIPMLQAAGGVLLLGIAWKLLRGRGSPHQVAESGSVLEALRTIVLADMAMSLDNILGVAGASHGSLGLLIFGLMLSMPLILGGSSLIARLMNRLPWLELVGAGVLAWTAGAMIVEDGAVARLLPVEGGLVLLLPATFVLALLAPFLGRLLPVREGRARASMERVPLVDLPEGRGRRRGE